MRQIEVSTIIPLRIAFHGDYSNGLTDGLISQLSRLICKISLPKENPITVKIRDITIEEAAKRLVGRFKYHYTANLRFIELKTVIAFNPDNWKEKENDSLKDMLGYFYCDVSFKVQGLISRLVIASNIAWPGSINPMNGIIFFDGRFYDTSYSELYSRLDLMCADESAWSKVKLLRLEKVWKWINHCPDFEKGFSSSPLGRALAAFTYFFSSVHHIQDSPLNYLWPIVGLEAIYESN